jgi:hypothetical protein
MVRIVHAVDFSGGLADLQDKVWQIAALLKLGWECEASMLTSTLE